MVTVAEPTAPPPWTVGGDDHGLVAALDDTVFVHRGHRRGHRHVPGGQRQQRRRQRIIPARRGAPHRQQPDRLNDPRGHRRRPHSLCAEATGRRRGCGGPSTLEPPPAGVGGRSLAGWRCPRPAMISPPSQPGGHSVTGVGPDAEGVVGLAVVLVEDHDVLCRRPR